MTKITYEVVEHDGGWAYRVDGVFSELLPIIVLLGTKIAAVCHYHRHRRENSLIALKPVVASMKDCADLYRRPCAAASRRNARCQRPCNATK